MPRILPVDPATAAGKTAELLAATRKAFGSTPNLFTTAANSPAALDAMLGLFGALGKSSLGAKVGEQIALTVAQTNECGYCLSAHTAIGAMHGLDRATLHAARHAEAAEPRTAALLRLAHAIVETRGHIDDATLNTARLAGITDAEVVEVVAHVALNIFTNYLNSVSETVIDFPLVELGAAA